MKKSLLMLSSSRMSFNKEDKKEFREVLIATRFPAVFLFFMLAIKALESALNTSFYELGVLPLKAKGLIGILTSPLVHSDWEHLFHNGVPWMVLGTMLFYFHKKRGMELFFAMYFMGGIWLWIIGRPVYHIGASGVVYAFAAYHITYGFVLRNPPMLALSFLIILFYGSMVWLLFPFVPEISWEAHLCGALSGVLLAIYYGKIFKKSVLEKRGSVNYSLDKIGGEEVEFVYHYKESKK